MKRLLTFLYLLLGLMLLDKSTHAQAPATGTPFMNLPDTTCWNSFASTNAFYWGAGNADSATWTIDRTDYTLLYTSDTKHKLVGQLPDVTYHKNSLTIKFTGKGSYTISAKLYKNNVASTVTKTIYVKDCSILPCQGKNTGVGDFKEDFGRFKTGATNSVSNPAVTGYQYKSIPLGGGGFPDDSYTIFWNTHVKNEWENTTDHTGSTKDSVGGMLIANSSIEKKTFFQKKNVPVCPGSSYNFSAWFLNLNGIEVFNSTCAAGNSDGYHYAGVSFLIIDNSNPASPDTLARFKTYDVSMNLSGPQWQMYGGGFQTPGGVTSVTLEIVNDRLGDCGNDIAIDDISFSYCSPYIYSFIDGQVNPPLKKDSLCEGAPVTIKASYSPNGWQSDGTYDKSKDYFKNPVYQWEFSGDGINWTPLTDSGTIRTGSHDSILVFKDGALVGDPDQPIDLYYRVGINELGNASNCASPSEYTKITILPRPKVTVSSGRICRGEQVVLQADGGYSTYEWKVNPVVLGPTLTVVPDTTSTYWAIGIADYGLNSVTGLPRQCMDSGQATVIVDTLPKVTITGGPVNLCLGSPIALEIPASNAGFNIVWTPAGTGTPNVVTFEDTPAKLDTNKYYVTVTNGTCVVADTFKVKTFAIPVPKATAPATQCDNGSFNLNAVLQPGETGLWSLVTPDPLITITDPAAATTTITGVPAGTPLQVRWTVTNAANTSCTHDTVIVINNQAAIDGNVVADDQVLCKTNDPRNAFTGGTLTGGSGTYTYRWQRSTDGITFTNITGATGPNYTPPAPANSTTVYYYRRTVTSGTCTSISNIVTLRVNTQPISGSAPVDKVVECITGTDYTTYFGTPTFTGFNVTISAPVDNTTNPDACTQLVKRSWTGTDACGKKLTVTQIVTVKDTKPPVFSYVPSGDTTVSCDELLLTPDPVAADDCSGVTITSSESTHIPGSCANEYSYTITWTATDACGNIATTKQLVHVEDKTPPVFTWKPVADTTVECDQTFDPEDLTPIATDKCSGTVTITSTESAKTPGSCANEYSYTITWTATDVCGNTTTTSQLVHVEDKTPPVFTWKPATDTIIECDQTFKPEDLTPIATDKCSGTVTITSTESAKTPGSCANEYSYTITWTATDVCGNTTTTSQLVHVEDKTPPVFTWKPVADTTVECDKTFKPEDLTPIAVDKCSGTVTITSTESAKTPGSCANEYSYTITWTATDVCGNTTTTSQLVHVEDKTPPVFTWKPVADTTIECDQTFKPEDLTPIAVDKCSGTVTITSTESAKTPGSCANEYSYTITWTAKDACGNAATTSQLVHVEDKTPPVFTWKPVADTTIECDQTFKPEDLTPIASDKCSGTVTITSTESAKTPGSCANEYSYTITWTATDVCGNATTTSQLVHVEDKTPPVFTWKPAVDTIIECDQTFKPEDLTPIAVDKCSGTVTITSTESAKTPGSCANEYSYTITWTATDVCGNTTTTSQLVHVEDKTPPVFTWKPVADTTVECDQTFKPEDLTPIAVDKCSGTVTITSTESAKTPGSCANEYSYTITWTATDVCGNTTTTSQLVHVEDKTPPVFTWKPAADTTIECDQTFKPEDLTPIAVDKCSGTVTITSTESAKTPGSCANEYSYTITWTATDVCGNTTTTSQLVHVEDKTPPVFTWKPAVDTIIECDQTFKPEDLTPIATDKCSGTVTITSTESAKTPGSCANEYSYIITWTATDVCGNATTTSQLVHVEDKTPPVFTWKPVADTTIECDKTFKPEDLTPIAVDKCSGTVTITSTESAKTPGSCANEYSYTITWTATDVCGNATTTSQVVHVEDKTPPVFTWKPAADTIIECDQTFKPEDLTPIAVDKCSGTVTITSTESAKTPGSCANEYSYTITWTATDVCGNTTTTSQLVHVEDKTPPVFTWKPAVDTTIECDKTFKPEDITPIATDKCSGTVTITSTESAKTPGSCANEYSYTITWTATDVCGNTTTTSQLVHVEDKTPPVFTWKPVADTTIECDKTFKPEDLTPIAVDKCSGTVTITSTESAKTPGSCANEYSYTITWTAKDACGNTTTTSQLVHVEDKTPPVFTWKPVADTTIECDKTFKPEDLTPIAVDKCSGTVTITSTESAKTPGSCANEYSYTITWTAKDACGNAATTSQVVHVEDKTPPVFTWKPVADTTVECDKTFKPEDLTPIAVDKCSGTVTITSTESAKTPGSCANEYSYTITWTAKDACGNTTTTSQLVHVEDKTPPVFTWKPVADTTVECDQTFKPEDLTPIAVDKCSGTVTITSTESAKTPGSCANEYSYTIIWTAKDACGNTTTTSQLVHVEDKTPPVFTWKPAVDTTIECDKTFKPEDLTPIAVDKCSGTVTITSTESAKTPGSCANEYSYTITWTATDACGNTTTTSQLVHVEDKTPPVFTWKPVADTTIECDKTFKPEDLTPIAVDKCSGTVTITSTESAKTPGSCANEYSYTITWTAKDACGNTTTTSQLVHVEDKTPPVFTWKPATDTTIECDQTFKPEDLTPIATDKCSGTVTITSTESAKTPGSCANEYSYTITWTAKDACGNTTTTSQLVHVEDKTPPVFTWKPAVDTTIECDKTFKPEDLTPIAVDKCSGTVTITSTESAKTPGSCANEYSYTITWTATDVCGNTTTTSQLVHVEDKTPPVFTWKPVADTTIECDQTFKPEDLTPIAVDKCSGTVTITSTESAKTPGSCANEYSYTITWTAKDVCGNATTTSQVVHVEDKTPPVFTWKPAADTIIECDQTFKPEDLTPIATDKCSGTVTITSTESAKTPGSCANEYSYTITWTATDVCGNTTTTSQLVHVEDKTPPVFTWKPAVDTTIECDKTFKPEDITPIATDKCSGTVTITSTESAKTPGSCANEYSYTITWTATDVCGNTTTTSQLVHVEDKTPPVFTWKPAADTTIECDKTFKPEDLTPVATDKCSGTVTITSTESAKTPGSCANEYSYTITWTAKDACGNTATTSQLVHVEDKTPPVFTWKPVADTTIECDKTFKPEDLTPIAVDKCSGTVTITSTESAKTPGSCANEYSYTITWTAKDACGNTTTTSQLVHVVDKTPPVFTWKPAADTTIECDQTFKPEDLTPIATDKCSGTVTITSTESAKTPGSCANEYSYTITWIAKDACGNTATTTQRVHVVDNTPPVFTWRPAADTTVDCDKTFKPEDLTPIATDKCSGTVTITSTESAKTPGSCLNTYSYTITWTATDACGNVATTKQLVYVVDNTPPVFIWKPAADTTVNCDKTFKPEDLTPIATDKCSGTVTITSTESAKTPGSCANEYSYTITWTAKDVCGNTTTTTQVVHVVDNTAPIFTLKPATDTTVNCDAVPKPADVKYAVIDNCTPTTNIKVTYSESAHTSTPGCANAYTFTRTWVAEDACGNTSTIKQKVTVVDKTAPVFTLKPAADTTVDCDKVPAPSDVKYTVTDNCTPVGNIKVTYSESTKTPTTGCIGAYSFIRTWVAEDGCGNSATIKQTVHVIDRTAPVFTWKPATDTTVECSAVPKPGDVKFSVTDNCTPVGNIKVNITDSKTTPVIGCANAYTFTRTWTATDACGNSASTSQTVHVTDRTAPVFTFKPAADTTVDCDKVPDPADVKYVVTDNCTPAANIKVTYSETGKVPTAGCANAYTFTRIWVAEDGCGNSATLKQNVTVIDRTAPVFTWKPVADTTVDCNTVPDKASVKFVVTDNCTPSGDIKVTYSETTKVPAPGCANAYTFTRIWVAEDGCGNKATLKQNVNVIDRTAPVFTLKPAADTTVDCDKVPAKDDVKYTVTDNCTPAGNIKVTYSESPKVPTAGCTNAYTFVRTWVATDGCSNSATIKQTVHVVDRTAPVFTWKPAADTTVDCDKVPDPSQVRFAVTDNCTPTGNIKVAYSESPKVNTPGCANGYTFTRKWVATDGCGNSATITQNVTVVDRTAPVFTLKPATDTTVDCDKVPVKDDVKYAVTDNCTPLANITVSYSESPKVNTPGCANAYTFTRTWVAADGCGNTATIKQNVTVIDRTAPVFTWKPAADTIVDCDKVPSKDDVKYAVTDNCTPVSDIQVTYSESPAMPTPGCANAYTFTRTWVATDGCGNTATTKQNVTVIDRTAPVFTLKPATDTTVDCDKVPARDDVKYAVTDNCTPIDAINVSYSESPKVPTPGCANAYTFTRTWVAADGCGNTATIKQNVTVVDRTAPVFTLKPATDTTVDCDNVPGPSDVKYTVTDNCTPAPGVKVTYSESPKVPTPGCVNGYTFTRTWVATDGCGNATTIKQNVTVVDRTPPVFTVKPVADTTVDCDKVAALDKIPVAATDNCSPAPNVRITFSDAPRVSIPGCANGYTFVRTWTATDDCNNMASLQQRITVQDTTRPVFSMQAPKDTVVDCDKVPAWPVITATDNCSSNIQVITGTKTVKLPGTCAGNYQEIRTWTASDDCGNRSVMQQIITVQDTTKPVFTVKPPADTTVSCDDIPAPAKDVQVTDNCSGIGNGLSVSRRIVTETIPGGCAGNYRIIRTWIAKDACGNTTAMTQVVTVKDTTRPVIMPAPADVVIFCQDKIPAPPVLTATDNCDQSFPKRAIYTEDPFVEDICNGYTIVRRWSIMDACGNKANDVIQRVVIKPCDKPQLEAMLPANCSDNGRIALRRIGKVYLPVYTLVSVTPSNVVTGLPLSQSNNVFNLNGATSASFIITDSRTGCSSDTMTYDLAYIQKPMVNLGNDTTICGGNSLVLDAGPANFAYNIKWSTGATTQRINVTKAGTYWVNVSNGQCATTDTIHVGLIPTPLIDIPDTTICRGQTVKLDAYVNDAQYLWSNGATASSILVGTQEQFWVKVMKAGCITIDTVKVSVNPPPDISLSRDTSICPDQSIMLTVNSNGGRIRWQTGETGNSIVVNQPGGYWVAVSRDNCIVRDTVNVRMKPAVTLDLGPDRNICPGGTITLDGTNPDAISYLWNDGDPKPVKQVSQAGRYKLAVMDKYCQRVYIDSVNVNITGLPKINLGRDTTLCKGETLILRAEGGGITGARWDNGSSGPSLTVSNGGTYTVTVFNDCGSATDDITVDVVQCEPKPAVPNAFSPNGDGRNDVFRPVVRGQMFDYELRIFNRWGELIFMTSDDHRGWDGKYKGVPVDIGTYVWWLTYKKITAGPANILKGEVTVVR